jgi:hypothetical protein
MNNRFGIHHDACGIPSKNVRKVAGGRRRIVPKCAKLGNYWGDFDEINSGYTSYQMIDK